MNKKAKIRVARISDAPEILEIYKPYILDTPITFEENIPTIPDFKTRIKNILKDCPYLVCEVDNNIAGYAYASDHRSRAAYRWNKEVSVYVSPKHQRKNIARALYTSLFSILKEQGFANLLAGITLPNNPSVLLHETFGFVKCAEYHNIGHKNNKWHSVGWWELFIQNEKAGTPIEPIPFSNFIKKTEIKPFFKEGEKLLKI